MPKNRHVSIAQTASTQARIARFPPGEVRAAGFGAIETVRADACGGTPVMRSELVKAHCALVAIGDTCSVMGITGAADETVCQSPDRSTPVAALLGLLALLLFILPAAAVFSAEPARADLRVCNQTHNLVSIALGYPAPRGWQSEGWWVAGPGNCAIVYKGDLSSRYYYIFAADDVGGGVWDGKVYMCTQDDPFTIFGVEDCLARGYERTGFFEVDTQNRSDWTLQLTDS